MMNGAQFGRAYSLTVSGQAATGESVLDLSALHFKFFVRCMDVETPNTMDVRIYNPSSQTAERLRRNEFTKIQLSAGYQDGVNYGLIFAGDIKHVHTGRENNIDNYIQVLAGDGDLLYNFGVVNTSVGPDATPKDVFNVLDNYAQQQGCTVEPTAADVFASTGGVLPRGGVLFGLFRNAMGQLNRAARSRWSIRNGQLIVVKDSGYLPGTVVVLNSTSGLIGVPEVTDNGISVRTLLNGLIQIGGQVQINQRDINKQIVQQQGYPNYNSLYFPAQTTSDGTYRVLVLNHEGDTRGQAWYSDMVCLALDKGAAQIFPGSSNLVGSTQ